MQMMFLISLYRNWISQINVIHSVKSTETNVEVVQQLPLLGHQIYRRTVHCNMVFYIHVFFIQLILMHNDDDIISLHMNHQSQFQYEMFNTATFPCGN